MPGSSAVLALAMLRRRMTFFHSLFRVEGRIRRADDHCYEWERGDCVFVLTAREHQLGRRRNEGRGNKGAR